MRYQDRIIQMTERAHVNFLKAVRAMPEDRLQWKPLDTGRSALDQLQEVAQAPSYGIPMLRDRKAPEWNPENYQAIVAARQAFDTIDKCEEVLRQNADAFYAIVRDFPDDDLDTTLRLPFAGGFDSAYAEIMAYPYWNAVYHLGQVNFIQTLYGDWEMR